VQQYLAGRRLGTRGRAHACLAHGQQMAAAQVASSHLGALADISLLIHSMPVLSCGSCLG